MIIFAAITKRAQIPFSAWLPAAIAAPTPVSSLVHSSTLVTAGVYLIIRFYPLLNNKTVLFFVFLTGLITILMSGWVANFENDLKKVIALSTLSQLGLIFIILGAGSYVLAFFHLIMHALFKSTLFICAGFIIHNLQGRQDRRFRGFSSFNSPYLGVVFTCTNLALCGFPFLRGFYSKDRILEFCLNNPLGNFIIILIIISTGLTLSYRFRILFLINSYEETFLKASISKDFRNLMIYCTIILFSFSVIGGYYFF